MAALPMSGFVTKFHSFNPGLEISRSRILTASSATNRILSNPQTRSSKELIDENPYHKAIFEELYTCKQSMANESAELEREIQSTVVKLKAAVERVTEMEVKKLRCKGTVSDEESILVESMSKEISTKFLEMPVRYLTSCSGRDLRDRMKDINFLVGMLEKSGSTVSEFGDNECGFQINLCFIY
ncbi:hypothetical protein K2173_003053 [Erythroxylum novogranatense]|uniref:Tetrapyrrole biosynthesis glutamyl-tRNA reductase dimerisation domain-containing protein n=1 Tax=Erythroxylum novogranatense TaxID=1862640 RepID=A0AAV8S894_9ROSI|nr:hypothetical protein K2173_003053 [Erythroxylum novogranatense]